MKNSYFDTADVMARGLLGRTDVNELAKCVSFLSSNLDGPLFFEYLDTIIAEGRAVVRSGQTLLYYRAIRDACREHLARYQDDPRTMARIMGWTIRLMRYYGAQDNITTSVPPPKSQFISKSPSRSTGRVKVMKEDRGFGFIVPDGGGQDVYVNQRDIVNGPLRPGQRVTYIVVSGPKGPQARDVTMEEGGEQ